MPEISITQKSGTVDLFSQDVRLTSLQISDMKPLTLNRPGGGGGGQILPSSWFP